MKRQQEGYINCDLSSRPILTFGFLLLILRFVFGFFVVDFEISCTDEVLMGDNSTQITF